MSGALVELVSKGAQDVYFINNEGVNSLFKTVFTRHTNFAMAPKRLEFSGQQPQANGTSSVFIRSFGDLVNYVWIEGDNLTQHLAGTTFDLYIGGQKIDSQSYEFLVYVWQQYQAESYSKAEIQSSYISKSGSQSFMPMQFFFCNMQSFLPVLALQYHEVEIRISWGPDVGGASNIRTFANYVYLDTREREAMIQKPMEIIISQVQRYQFPISEPQTTVDLSVFNHPVKTIFFGANATADNLQDSFTFSDASFQLNGTEVFEGMTPVYFYVVQSFFHTSFAHISFTDKLDNSSPLPKNQPKYTLMYMYNFCLNTTSYRPTGTCNFSRIDNAKLILNNVSSNKDTGYVYAINYNILKIQKGLGGILFSN